MITKNILRNIGRAGVVLSAGVALAEAASRAVFHRTAMATVGECYVRIRPSNFRLDEAGTLQELECDIILSRHSL